MTCVLQIVISGLTKNEQVLTISIPLRHLTIPDTRVQQPTKDAAIKATTPIFAPYVVFKRAIATA